MPAIDPVKLKKLLTFQVLAPFAMTRRLSGAQLADLVQRALADKRFDISASSDEFAGLMDESEAADWAAEFERTGTAPHLFSSQGQDDPKSEETLGGMKMSEVLKLSPEARLHLANKVADERRNGKKH